ncbi:hypothetical protein [Tychonema sp. LEGE 07203]|uniref:hypothetical protein n=1 Tax=Tychonema sp. LEGE 07203 TaxID=1828671 RepID=UPI0019FF1AA8|nr:hypothetical protein [Tychonema sp. LEGE 07203]MBE9093748.1 hypothetical protein [Tychonema sp. LEGE 07203]
MVHRISRAISGVSASSPVNRQVLSKIYQIRTRRINLKQKKSFYKAGDATISIAQKSASGVAQAIRFKVADST